MACLHLGVFENWIFGCAFGNSIRKSDFRMQALKLPDCEKEKSISLASKPTPQNLEAIATVVLVVVTQRHCHCHRCSKLPADTCQWGMERWWDPCERERGHRIHPSCCCCRRDPACPSPLLPLEHKPVALALRSLMLGLPPPSPPLPDPSPTSPSPPAAPSHRRPLLLLPSPRLLEKWLKRRGQNEGGEGRNGEYGRG